MSTQFDTTKGSWFSLLRFESKKTVSEKNEMDYKFCEIVEKVHNI